MNCGRSSSVEWKLPKLQRRVRFPSPAPPPPGRAPGGFVMPASRVQRGLAPPSAPEGTPRAHKRMRHRAAGNCTTQGSNTRATQCTRASRGAPTTTGVEGAATPPKPGRSASRPKISRPARPQHRHFHEKTRPAQSKRAHFGTKFAQQEPGDLIFDTKFAQLARNAAFSLILRVQGEFCLVVDDSKPSRANFVSQTY